jgi:hypothetical protein
MIRPKPIHFESGDSSRLALKQFRRSSGAHLLAHVSHLLARSFFCSIHDLCDLGALSDGSALRFEPLVGTRASFGSEDESDTQSE